MREKICIIGDGITALMLAKALMDLDIKIDLITKNNFKIKKKDSRTIGISDNNLFFLRNHGIINKKIKNLWKINKIKIYSSKSKLETNLLLNFENKEKNPIFHMVKNSEIYLGLKKKVQKNLLLNIIKEKDGYLLSKKFKKKQYKLVINCSSTNNIDKKYFFKKINKNYEATAHTVIVKHEKIPNNIAYQFFTDFGPMAFLPISEKSTSIVWSASNKNNIDNKIFIHNIKKLFPSNIKKMSFSSISKFKLNFLIPREYYFKNILNFGDGLHKIHPIAGQGLNMTIRDIKTLKSLIQNKINLGLELDSSILKDFDNKVKSYNFIFAKGIDFTEGYFSINNKFFNFYSNKLFNKINKNFFIKSFFMKFANKGLGI